MAKVINPRTGAIKARGELYGSTKASAVSTRYYELEFSFGPEKDALSLFLSESDIQEIIRHLQECKKLESNL